MPVPCSLVRRRATGIYWHYTVYEKVIIYKLTHKRGGCRIVGENEAYFIRFKIKISIFKSLWNTYRIGRKCPGDIQTVACCREIEHESFGDSFFCVHAVRDASRGEDMDALAIKAPIILRAVLRLMLLSVTIM